jgi:hypothetical protein
MPGRSAFAFQRRKQMRTLGWPSPRFSTAKNRLLVEQYPSPDGKPLGELAAGEGAPPSDRVKLNSWSPPPLEDTGDGS